MKTRGLLCVVLATVLLAGGCRKWPRDLREELDSAILARDTGRVERLLARGANPNAWNDVGNTALYEAIESGYLPTVQLLINYHADVNARTREGTTALHEAADFGQKRIVELLLDRHADVNAKITGEWKAGSTPLHEAVCARHAEIVPLLVAHGANLSATNDAGRTPLDEAVDLDDKEMVKLLLNAGAKATLASAACLADVAKAKEVIEGGADVRASHPALLLAATHGDANMVSLLIAAGADVNARTDRDETPLYMAIDKGHAAVAEMLMKAGADTNIYARWSPLLHMAVDKGRIDIVRLLLANGADVNFRASESGWTALHEAVRSYNEHIVQLRDRNSDNGSAGEQNSKLMRVVADHKAMLELLTEHGADVNARNVRGWTPLHILLERADWREGDPNELVDTVKFLIAHGADLNATGIDGDTPLHLAAGNGWARIAELLIAKGANINAKHKSVAGAYDPWPAGQTPLLRSLRGGMTDVANLLIAKGADINVRDASGATPLLLALHGERENSAPWVTGRKYSYMDDAANRLAWHAARHKAYGEIVRELLARGADPNAKDEDGDTPLHNAVQDGNEELARLLVASGADVNVENAGGSTALHYAVCESRSLTELLLSHGAAVDPTDRQGDTPLHNAALRGQADIVELLLTKGANPNARNNAGQTPLDKATRRRHSEIVDLLRKHGATE